jgi:hypothetical protein
MKALSRVDAESAQDRQVFTVGRGRLGAAERGLRARFCLRQEPRFLRYHVTLAVVTHRWRCRFLRRRRVDGFRLRFEASSYVSGILPWPPTRNLGGRSSVLNEWATAVSWHHREAKTCRGVDAWIGLVVSNDGLWTLMILRMSRTSRKQSSTHGRAQRDPARRTEPQRPAFRHRRSHVAASGLCGEPAKEEAHRGTIRMRQHHRRARPTDGAWRRKARLQVHPDDGPQQSDPPAKAHRDTSMTTIDQSEITGMSPMILNKRHQPRFEKVRRTRNSATC